MLCGDVPLKQETSSNRLSPRPNSPAEGMATTASRQITARTPIESLTMTPHSDLGVHGTVSEECALLMMYLPSVAHVSYRVRVPATDVAITIAKMA